MRLPFQRNPPPKNDTIGEARDARDSTRKDVLAALEDFAKTVASLQEGIENAASAKRRPQS